jgi:hypothetical protein
MKLTTPPKISPSPFNSNSIISSDHLRKHQVSKSNHNGPAQLFVIAMVFDCETFRHRKVSAPKLSFRLREGRARPAARVGGRGDVGQAGGGGPGPGTPHQEARPCSTTHQVAMVIKPAGVGSGPQQDGGDGGGGNVGSASCRHQGGGRLWRCLQGARARTQEDEVSRDGQKKKRPLATK